MVFSQHGTNLFSYLKSRQFRPTGLRRKRPDTRHELAARNALFARFFVRIDLQVPGQMFVFVWPIPFVHTPRTLQGYISIYSPALPSLPRRRHKSGLKLLLDRRGGGLAINFLS